MYGTQQIVPLERAWNILGKNMSILVLLCMCIVYAISGFIENGNASKPVFMYAHAHIQISRGIIQLILVIERTNVS
jgi:hypothetical protein